MLCLSCNIIRTIDCEILTIQYNLSYFSVSFEQHNVEGVINEMPKDLADMRKHCYHILLHNIFSP